MLYHCNFRHSSSVLGHEKESKIQLDMFMLKISPNRRLSQNEEPPSADNSKQDLSADLTTNRL